MEVRRRKFQGVLNILSFNRHYYFFGITVLAAFFISRWFIEWNEIAFWIVIAAFLYGLIIPLVVSAYVYDFSGYYHFNWLNKVLNDVDKVNLIVNINAGFDETSFILHNKFPQADIRVYDFYNASQHTEPAIIRARKVSLVYPNTQQIDSDSIPLEASSADTVFLLSAAHEIRSHKEKIQFQNGCNRI